MMPECCPELRTGDRVVLPARRGNIYTSYLSQAGRKVAVARLVLPGTNSGLGLVAK